MPTQDSSDEPPRMSSRLFLPPVNRAMRTLDPSFFQKTIPLTAAHVFDGRSIPRVRTECSKDLLLVPRLKYILTEKGADGQTKKLILLRPEVKHDEEIMNAILPEELDDIPCAFTTAGHLAHLNLRENYLPYKHLIARVLLDKNPNISTVVNKVEDVGTGSVYRTFPMELLAGLPQTEVSVRESGCVFRFDFAKVYWNSRLGHEHGRIVDLFKPGDAVADVMAGVGPFAIPAAKKGVYVYANDLNPESYKSLRANIQANKVARFASAYNQDGREFIRGSIRALLDFSRSKSHASAITNQQKPKRKQGNPGAPPLAMTPAPPTFSHLVMNLPASATTFLDAFRGAYNGLEDLFSGGRQLPMIHVYTFHKSPESEAAAVDICMDISKRLGYEVKPSDLDNLENVRLVSPNKTYYCVSFRLPPEVAFVGEEEERGNRR